jgi:hypothetical protein
MSVRAQSCALVRRRTKAGLELRLTRRAGVEAAAFGVASAAMAVTLSGVSVALGSLLAVIIALLALGSSLVHELAHLRAARRRRLRVLRLEVTGALSGGVTREASTQPRTEIAVCLAGPAATLALIGASVIAFLALHDGPALGRSLALTMLTLNVAAFGGTLPVVPGSDVSRAWAAWRSEAPAPRIP